MKVEVPVLGSPSLIVLMVSEDVKTVRIIIRHCHNIEVNSELRSCVKVEVIVLKVSEDVRQH